MKPSVRHPRLNAFYNSRAMNITSMGLFASILFLGYSGDWLLSGVATVMLLGFAIGYTIWYWTGCRKHVEQSRGLSNFSSVYAIYVLVAMNFVDRSVWWIVVALVAVIAAVLIDSCRGADCLPEE